MSRATLCKSSIRSVTTGAFSPFGEGHDSRSTYRLIRSPTHFENRNSRPSTYAIVNAGDRNFLSRLWGSGRLYSRSVQHFDQTVSSVLPSTSRKRKIAGHLHLPKQSRASPISRYFCIHGDLRQINCHKNGLDGLFIWNPNLSRSEAEDRAVLCVGLLDGFPYRSSCECIVEM